MACARGPLVLTGRAPGAGGCAGGPAVKGERGQAAVLLVGVLLAVVVGGLLLGIYAQAVGARGDQQRAADLAALAGARAMRSAYPRVFELGPGRLSRAAYEAIGR